VIAALAIALALCAQGEPAAIQNSVPPSQAGRVISGIRVHGNHSTPDAVILELAGIKAGDAATDTTVKDIESRLRKSRRFDRVEVLARSRSLDGSDLSLVILVEEPFVVPLQMPGGAVVNTVRRIANRPLFLPILDFSDYGFSYGARASFVNITGRGSRFSFPFTWGAQKRAAAEYEHRFGPDRRVRVDGAASWLRRENPFYDINDTRREAAAGISYEIVRPLRAGVRGGLTDVTFADQGDRFPWVSAELTLDTRIDPELPREAVYGSVRWEHLAFDRYEAANRLRTDVRGYLGLIGQSVLAVRGLHVMSNTSLPPFERALIGGASTLRGSEFGFASGDNLAVGSIELRVPISSPLSMGRLGVNVFTDVGAAYDRGTRLRDAAYQWGYGAGVFFSATIFKLNLDVATDGKGHTRAHLASGFRF
jgi:outer membrane protein assembly factor BamA